MSKDKFKKYLTEALGTFCLVFIGTGAVAVNSVTDGMLGHLGISLAFGLVVLVMVYSIGHISGAHINPAVTLGFFAAKRMNGGEILPYIVAQLGGAVVASMALRILFSNQSMEFGMTLPSGSMTQSFIFEFIMTFILMFVILGVAHDNRAEGMMAGVAIGATVVFVALVGGPISGGSMNPARSFGPAFAAANFAGHWIYWIAPILGSVAGAVTYEFVKCPGSPSKDGQGCC